MKKIRTIALAVVDGILLIVGVTYLTKYWIWIRVTWEREQRAFYGVMNVRPMEMVNPQNR
jgi:hypothetical protein